MAPFERNRVMPWSEDEMAVIDGVRYIYRFEDGDLMIKLPGGGEASFQALRERGHVVAMPRRLRDQT